jgi:ABC-type branched-subunit amino acid transport system substrate-binding protein
MIRRSLVLMVLSSLFLTGCDLLGDEDATSLGRPTPGPTQTVPGRPPLKIGLVGSMGGPNGWRGEDAYEGADLGVHQVNRWMTDGARRYELQVLDDGGDPSLALEHLRSLLRGDDVVGVVYAGPPEGLREAESVLERAAVPVVALYGDLYGAERLSSHLFQSAPPYSWQARDLARYLTRDRGYERVGIMVEEGTHDGVVAARAAAEQLEDYGVGDPVIVEYGDLAAALARLRRNRVEAIVVQGAPGGFKPIFDELGRLQARYLGTPSARIASAPRKVRDRRLRKDWWHPQVAGFDQMITERDPAPPPGTVATAPYSRGAHYLPVPSIKSFRAAFRDWWDDLPLGYERRAYEATLALGWAAERASGDGDLARRLETLRGKRFGGLPVTLGPDDHLTVEEVTIGLWTVPAPGDRVPERERLPKELSWVPLARGFSIDGETTDILSSDWKWLFRDPPPPNGPAPKFARLRFGVRTPRSDPLR